MAGSFQLSYLATKLIHQPTELAGVSMRASARRKVPSDRSEPPVALRLVECKNSTSGTHNRWVARPVR